MKVVVVGRGFGAALMAPAYRALGCEVELVSSRDEAAVARACAAPVDLVSIHSPVFQHRGHVTLALAAGRNVLCDKPFGRNADEARAMRDAAHAAGVLHFLNFEFRAFPSWVQARKLLQEDAIGRLQHIDWSSLRGGMHGRRHGWLADAALGGGWIGAHGSHIIDGLRYFFGSEIARCGGLMRTDMPFLPNAAGEPQRASAEDGFSAWFVLENGGSASVDSCNTAATPVPSRIQMLGAEGTITITGEHVVSLQRRDAAPVQFDHSPKPGEHVFPAVPLWVETVIAALRETRRIAPDFDDGAAVVEVMDRLKSNAVWQAPPL